MESELFGHEKGAYTGAAGGFQAAQGGTLFLDEIGDLPLELQPKLLRVLQEQQFERVGSARTIQADVRVIAATNLSLREMVEEKSFRADLFYRLSVFPLALPPLRERKDDIDELVHHFVRIYSARMGKDIVHVHEAILETMHGYYWPGNIRELQNFIERAVITSPGDTLSPRPGELELLSRCRPVQRVQTLLDAERAHIIQALTETNWVVGGRNGAAARLGLPRTTLISRMQKLGLLRKRSEPPSIDFSLPQSFSDSQSGQTLSPA
jgi:formate hydrogenlyase transcriptional activator